MSRGLNMAARRARPGQHRQPQYFEGDGSKDNPLRSRLCSASCELSQEGSVSPLSWHGLGVDVDEEFLRAYPVTEDLAWR